jgi:hypothetical protein
VKFDVALRWSAVIALILVALTVSQAFAQGPTPTATNTATGPIPTTTTITTTNTITTTTAITPTATAVPAPTRRPGSSPDVPLTPVLVKPGDCIDMMCPDAKFAVDMANAGGWIWIDPNTTDWFKVNDYGGLQVSVWLYANGQSGMGMDIFAPEQKNWWEAKPIGRGSLNPNMKPADLFWSGNTLASGDWLIRVMNSNPYPINYSLRFSRDIPFRLNRCDACHAMLRDMMWGNCQDGPNSNWCSDLGWLYDQNPGSYDHSIPGP